MDFRTAVRRSTPVLVVATALISSCEAPSVGRAEPPNQNAQFIENGLVGLEDEAPLLLPSSLPAGFSLSAAPVFAESDGESIVLVDFIGEVDAESQSISVRVCESTSSTTARDFCSEEGNQVIRESSVGDIHLIIVTDTVPSPTTLNAWNAVEFVDYFDSEPNWTQRE